MGLSRDVAVLTGGRPVGLLTGRFAPDGGRLHRAGVDAGTPYLPAPRTRVFSHTVSPAAIVSAPTAPPGGFFG